MAKYLRPPTRSFSQLEKRFEASVVPKMGNQYSKYRLKDFGELPRGEIPRELDFVPASNLVELSNGSRLFTEEYPSSTTVVSLFVRAGSRYETQESMGAAHMLWNLAVKNEKTAQLGGFGARLQVSAEREFVGYHVEVLPENASSALEILCELVLAPKLDAKTLQNEKSQVFQNIVDVSRDQHLQSLEMLYFTCFRDHMMGQSAFGSRDNIQNLTARHLEEHIARTYAGRNLIAVVSGNMAKENELREVATRMMGSLPPASLMQTPNEDRPLHTPSTLVARDDEMHNVNIAIGYYGPPMSDPRTFKYRMFQEIIGQYDPRNQGASQLNFAGLSYNYIQRKLGGMPGVGMQTCAHIPASDHSLFTSFIHGNEVYGHFLTSIVPCTLSQATKTLNIVEVYRARARLFNKLLSRTASIETNKEIAAEVAFVGKRIDRAEAARRYSALACEKLLSKFAYEAFFDADLGVSFWGACHNLIETAYYSRVLTDATKGRQTQMVF